MTFLYSITIFLGAALLFLVQPMVAKMLLPSLGGTSNVWVTCMVFFQMGLLVGYGYAHAGPRWLGTRLHAYVHLALSGLAFLFLPIGLYLRTTGNDDPTFDLLLSLTFAVGLPYVVVSSTGPLLQKWFAVRQADPYFLYAASNLGSFAGLLSYPFLVEPAYTLSVQTVFWTWSYLGLMILMFLCGLPILVHGASQSLPAPMEPAVTKPSVSTRLHWMLLALVPSSLMLSVTTYLTTDIASVPLLWVLPIAIYLLSFVLVFARSRLIPHALVLRAAPAVVVVLVLVLLSEATEPPEILIAVHLIGLFCLCMMCHGELSRTRPAAEHVTEFYLWLAVGGALGGCFNAIVAPLLFNAIAEYPIMLVAACLLRPVPAGRRDEVLSTEYSVLSTLYSVHKNDVLVPIGVGFLTIGLILVGQSLSLAPGPISLAAMFALPCLVAYACLDRPLRFGLAVMAVLLGAGVYEGVHGKLEERVRSFFGVHRVTQNREGQFRILIHGNTVHGQQLLSGAPEERRRPLTYYHERSPIGQLLLQLRGDERLKRVALIGLGAGALAYYAEPKQQWTFFEIDPAVEKLARQHFTYLSDSKGDINVVTGDARIRLQKEPDNAFGVIVIDAFSSDSIPVHLLTREALALYRKKLGPSGVLAFHVSNRYLDLQAVLASLAEDAEMVALYQRGFVNPDDVLAGRLESEWVVLANREADIAKLRATRRWDPAKGETAAWTDDYSNLLSVLRLRAVD